MLKPAGIIVTILLMVFLIYILRNKVLDNFIVFLDDVIIPSTCYNYLVTNGKQYFLLNTNKILDGVSNPLAFSNKKDAINYLKVSKCPENIPFVDLVMRKKIDDPTVSYQRACGKKVAPNLFDLDSCSTYASDKDSLSGATMARYNQIENDKKIYANYDIETCMIDNATTENPELDDTHFSEYFSKYFDRMNSNIDDKYLYISGR